MCGRECVPRVSIGEVVGISLCDGEGLCVCPGLMCWVCARTRVLEGGCVQQCLLGPQPPSRGVSEGEKKKMTIKGQITGPSRPSSFFISLGR